MESQTVKDGKTMAVVSYLTIIGTLIAFLMNQKKFNVFASFHIRQSLGIFLTGMVINFLQRFNDFAWLDTILGIGLLILWVLGLVSAIQGQEKPIPILGEYFQDWFRNIS